MTCKFCNAENPDGAVFCSSCGRRIDGKTICPNCGAANNEGAVYCNTCGKRIDGKRTCPNCGAILPEGTLFCSECGHASAQVPAETPQTDPATKKPLSHWLNLSGGIALLASAAFALIFIFCLGLTSSVTSGLTSTGGGKVVIYDFFSEYYKQIELSLQNIKSNGEYLAFPRYFNAAFGTLIAAGSLVSIPVCVTLAAIRFARSVRGAKGNTDYFSPAAAAYAIFLCSACVLLALFAGSTAGAADNIAVSLNDATLAGVILGGIFFGAGCGLRIAAKGKAFFTRKTITSGVIAAVGSVFAVILLAFATQGAVGIKAAGIGTANIMSYMELAGIQFLSKIQSTPLGEPVASPDGVLAASVFAVLFQIAVIVLATSLIVLLWRSLAGEQKSSAANRGICLIVVAAVLLACAVSALASSILFGNLFSEYMGLDAETVTLTYTAPIVILVFSAILFAAAIIDAVLTRPVGDGTSSPRL